jgi:hypothetical protein
MYFEMEIKLCCFRKIKNKSLVLIIERPPSGLLNQFLIESNKKNTLTFKKIKGKKVKDLVILTNMLLLR